MNHEKIIKREDGRRVKISVRNYEHFGKGMIYDLNVSICEPGKKKFFNVVNSDDYRYRALSMEDRLKHNMATYLQHASSEELLAAKLELWEKLRPV